MLNRNSVPVLLWASMIYAWYIGRVCSLADWSQASLRFHWASALRNLWICWWQYDRKATGLHFRVIFLQRSISEVFPCAPYLHSAFYVRWKPKINSKRSSLSLVLFLLFIFCLASSFMLWIWALIRISIDSRLTMRLLWIKQDKREVFLFPKCSKSCVLSSKSLYWVPGYISHHA